MCAYASIIAQVILRFQLAHLTGEIFISYTKTAALTWVILLANLVFGFTDEVTLYTIINFVGWSVVAHQIYFTTRELCEIEDIYVFFLKKKKQPQAAKKSVKPDQLRRSPRLKSRSPKKKSQSPKRKSASGKTAKQD